MVRLTSKRGRTNGNKGTYIRIYDGVSWKCLTVHGITSEEMYEKIVDLVKALEMFDNQKINGVELKWTRQNLRVRGQ